MIDIKFAGFEKEIERLSEQLSFKKIGQIISREILPPIETRLVAFAKEIPPPRDNTKFVWSFNRAANDRARRWWWANLKEGNIPTDGSHYLRSNTIPNAWKIDLFISRGQIILNLFNDAPGSEHVYGSPEQTQVPSHADTGWHNYKELRSFLEVVQNELSILWPRVVESSIKRQR